MAETTNPNLVDIDNEYRTARDAYYTARAVYRAVAERRQRAHRIEELKRSSSIRELSALSGDEQAGSLQIISDPAPFSANIQVNQQG